MSAIKIRTRDAMKVVLQLCAVLPVAAADEDSTVAREQAQSYFDPGDRSPVGRYHDHL
ncbi:MAG TPA: hypothetical protein VK961_21035 [Chthoniobacter sp.]|nr:hypothetical protein [Chthoniobacter sp.]